MIFNPLFIDLETRQINSIGQNSTKGSYLFRDIINLENNNPEKRVFDTTNILSNLLTQVSNLSKKVDNNDSQLNSLLTRFRISGSQLSKIKKSPDGFENDAPLLIDSKEKIDQIITKTIEGLTSEFNFQVINKSSKRADIKSSDNYSPSTEELINKLKRVTDETGQLSILFFNPESNESFRLSIQKVTANDGLVDNTNENNAKYLLSISAENFNYKDGNMPFIQKIIDANKYESVKGNIKTEGSEKTINRVSESQKLLKNQSEMDLNGIDTAIKSDIKSLLGGKTDKPSIPKSELRKTKIDIEDVKENVIPKVKENKDKSENENVSETPQRKFGKTKTRITSEWIDNRKILFSNKKLQEKLEPNSQKKAETRTNFIDKIDNTTKTTSELFVLSNDKDSTLRIKLVPKEEGYEELNIKQLKNYVEGSEKASNESKVKFSPLLEKLTVISARNLKAGSVDSSEKNIDDINIEAKLNSGNDKKTSEINKAFTNADTKIDPTHHKEISKQVEQKAIESSKNNINNSSLHYKSEHEVQDIHAEGKLAINELNKANKMDDVFTKTEINQKYALGNDQVKEVGNKPEEHHKDDFNNSSSHSKSGHEVKSKDIDANGKDKLEFKNVIKNESDEARHSDSKNKIEAKNANHDESTSSDKNRSISEKQHTEDSKVSQKNESDSTTAKSAHKTNEINSTNNQHNIFGKEIKTNNQQTDFTQTVKVNPKAEYQPQLNQRMVEEISDMVISEKKDKAVINLEPASLGKVKIMVELVDNKVAARVDVENQAAKEMLQNQIQFLKDALNSSGIQLGSLNISHQNNDPKGTRADKGKKQDDETVSTSKTKKEAKEDGSKNLGYNTYEYIA